MYSLESYDADRALRKLTAPDTLDTLDARRTARAMAAQEQLNTSKSAPVCIIRHSLQNYWKQTRTA